MLPEQLLTFTLLRPRLSIFRHGTQYQRRCSPCEQDLLTDNAFEITISAIDCYDIICLQVS